MLFALLGDGHGPGCALSHLRGVGHGVCHVSVSFLVSGMETIIFDNSLCNEPQTLKCCVHPVKRLADPEDCDLADPYPLHVVIPFLSGLDRKGFLWPEPSPSSDTGGPVK